MNSGLRFRPTRQCLILGAILVAMFLAAINYDNNLAYGVLFWVIGLCVVAAVHGAGNVANIRIRVLPPHPVFAGGSADVEILALRETGTPAVELVFMPQGTGFISTSVRMSEIRALDSAAVRVELPVPQRGEGRLTQMEVRSVFPFGIFEFSRLMPVGVPVLVYPRPEGKLAPPRPEGETPGGPAGDGEDYHGVRLHRPGESLRRVDWKAVARGRPLLVKEFGGNVPDGLSFEWQGLSFLPVEARVSQLTQWVLTAEADGRRYGLKLPGVQISPGQGKDHRHACLKALALV